MINENEARLMVIEAGHRLLESRFAALELASPVWQLYGKPGLVAHGFPKADVPFNAGTLGYHLRTGVHDITRYDWQCYMDFAEAHGWLNSLGRDDGASADAGRSSIVLAERGGRAGAVFCPPDASKRMLKAADEYATYVERIVGVRPEIVSSPGSAVVLLEQDESKSLGVDGFRLCAKDGKLRVTGGQRGVLYGIYEILETYCGVGWFSSWHEVVPTRDELSVPADLDEVQRPAFEVRDALWYDVMSNAEFADRLRINGGSFGFDNQSMILLEAEATGLPTFFVAPDMAEVVPAAGAINCVKELIKLGRWTPGRRSAPTAAEMAEVLDNIEEKRIQKMSEAMLKHRKEVLQSTQLEKLLKLYDSWC